MSNLTEIIQLFESRHTEQLSDRHAEAILNFCKLYKTVGKCLYYRELEELAHVFGLVHKSLVNGKVNNGEVRIAVGRTVAPASGAH